MRKRVCYRRVPDEGVGFMSDGSHTFNELYHHRAVLFSVICNTYKEYAWKSKLHHDGTMYNNYFIVGMTIPGLGQVSYHYDLKYWNIFMVKEFPNAPEWDGSSSDDTAKRLLKFSLLMTDDKD